MKKYDGMYENMVECQACGFKEIISIKRSVAVQNAICPECGQKKLIRSN